MSMASSPPPHKNDASNAQVVNQTGTVQEQSSQRKRSIMEVNNVNNSTNHKSQPIPEPPARAASNADNQNDNDKDDDTEDRKPAAVENETMPYAPTVRDFMARGGTKRYLPRPEWCKVSTKNRSNRKRPRQNEEEEQDIHSLADEDASPSLEARPANDPLYDEYMVAHFVEVAEDTTSIPSREAVAHPCTSSASTAATASPSRYSNAFGREFDTALHVAIREKAVDAALSLLQHGAPVYSSNAKRVTPLILAAQKGMLEVVKELLVRGASPLDVTSTGSSAMLQAAHFGHLQVVKLLVDHGGIVEMANYKNTTALMRASQEGHADVVRYLMQHGAVVNRRNHEQMSSLMLASQRGHADICQMLLDAQAEVDAMTPQRSTALMLAAKREHIGVVQVLVAAGCELMIKDSRGRTVRQVALQRRNADGTSSEKTMELLLLLDPNTQIRLMQKKARVQRNYQMAQLWALLQHERATLPTGTSIHEVTIGSPVLTDMPKSQASLIRAMTLPAPMLELIATFMPLPAMWDTRLRLITKRCSVDPDCSVANSLELIDEVLEEGGFLEACDIAKVPPPPLFKNWVEWKVHCKRHQDVPPSPEPDVRPNSLQATLPGLPLVDAPLPTQRSTKSAVEQRRDMCFLQILAHRSPMLQRVLLAPPFCMSKRLIQQLITVNDIQSLSARLGSRGVTFEAVVAIEMVMLASSVCNWHGQVRDDFQECF
jgi:ankyrin repeat protein